MFFFVTSALSIYHIKRELAFPDNCTVFHAQNVNGKSKILNLIKNQVICLDASYIMASKSSFDVYTAFQRLNAVNNTWYWDHKERKENPLAVLGSYYHLDNEYLDPVTMIVCTDKTCAIQILEVDPSFDFTLNQTEGGITNIFRFVRNSYLSTKSEGTFKTDVHLSKTISAKTIETTVEQSRVFFSFPTFNNINYSHSKNVRLYYSYAEEWDDEYSNKSSGIFPNTKTSFMYVEEKSSYTPTPDKNGNYDVAMTCNFTWVKGDKQSNDSTEPTEFFFPDIYGTLPKDHGVYYADDINEPPKKTNGWVIFAVIVIILAIIGIIVGIVFWWRRRHSRYETI